MSLAELNARYEAFVRAVTKRIGEGTGGFPPRDADAILDSLPAMTVSQHPPLYFAVDMRGTLQKNIDIDKLADEFVARWRDQVRADESI